MRHLALAVAGMLVFALIGPAQGQPFADVPTSHWAYDAIAQLAAKGLIEGYPDGTFKGDRAMTRYEMAMVVARLLARIESIQVPAPAKPEVTKADLEAIQRLVNEFRAELAALGVRVTAIEEEINAIKARLDNVRITGAFRLLYNDFQPATGASLNGNPRAKSVDASASARVPEALVQSKLSFDGSVAPNIHLIVGLLTGSAGGTSADFSSSNFGFGAAGGQWTLATVDNLFLDWRNAFGWPLEIWLGRFGGSGRPLPIGKNYPVQFGPFGLVLNTAAYVWRDSTLDSGANVVDGVRVAGHWRALADLQVQGLIARVVGGVGGTSYASGEDAYGIDANIEIIPGLRIGGSYVGNSFNIPEGIPVAAGAPNAFWHVYGPGAGAENPATPNCPAVTVGSGGIRCPAAGSGYSGYAQWNITPTIHFDGEYAWWNDAVLGGGDNGWQVNVHWDLGKLTGIGHNFFLDTGYLNFGQNFYPPYGAEIADFFRPMHIVLYPGNENGFLGRVAFDPIPKWTLYGIYFGGNHISNGQSVAEWEAGVVYQFAPNATVVFKARELRIAGVEQFSLYRAQVDYSF